MKSLTKEQLKIRAWADKQNKKTRERIKDEELSKITAEDILK